MGLKDTIGFINSVKSLNLNSIQIRNLFNCVYHNLIKSKLKPRVNNYLPISLGIYINMKCNLRCEFCYYDWDNEDIIENISVENFKHLLSFPLFKHAFRLTLAGGEPFLHPDILNLISIGHETKHYISLHTNGTLIHKFAKDLSTSFLNSINISLYQDHLDDQLKNIQYLLKFNKTNKNPMRVSISYITTSNDYQKMDKIIELAASINVKNVFFQNYYTDNDKKLSLYDDNLDYKKYINRLQKKIRQYDINCSLPQLIKTNLDITTPNYCAFPFTLINIDQKGNISPCCYIAPPRKAYGNIFETNDPWNGQFYTTLRKSILNKDKEQLMNTCLICPFLNSNFKKLF